MFFCKLLISCFIKTCRAIASCLVQRSQIVAFLEPSVLDLYSFMDSRIQTIGQFLLFTVPVKRQRSSLRSLVIAVHVDQDAYVIPLEIIQQPIQISVVAIVRVCIDIDTNEGEYEYLNMGGEDRDPIRDNIILGRFDARTGKVVRVLPLTQYGISPRNEEQVFAMDAVMNKDVELVSLTGTAGTGKTLLAVAGALAQADYYEQILVARPVITLQNEEMGFLPGDVQEKLAPFMQPLYDNIAVIKKNFGPSAKENIKIEEMLRTKKLEIAPLAYIRGRSLQKTFFIIDEAQNLTPHEVKTIITRAGEGTKIVFTGDVQQIDQPYLDKYSNGLTHISDKLYGEKLFEHVNLIMGERSALSELAGKKL